jgi:hypothetical protein
MKFLAYIRQWWHCAINGCQPCKWAEDEGTFAIACTCGQTFWAKNEKCREMWQFMAQELIDPNYGKH